MAPILDKEDRQALGQEESSENADQEEAPEEPVEAPKTPEDPPEDPPEEPSEEASEEAPPEEGTEEGAPEDAPEKPEPTLEEQLEDETTRRTNAEGLIEAHKRGDITIPQKGKEKPVEEPPPAPQPEEDTEEDSMEDRLERRAILRENRRDALKLLRAGTQSDSEFKLALFHYDKSVKLSGDVELDVENALALITKKRLEGTTAEALRSARSADTKGSGKKGAGLTPDQPAKRPKFNAATERFIKNRNLKWDPNAINPTTGKKGWFVHPGGKPAGRIS